MYPLLCSFTVFCTIWFCNLILFLTKKCTMQYVIARPKNSQGIHGSVAWLLIHKTPTFSFQDYMVIDPSVNGFVELHDRYRDMRLDVDNMSYEVHFVNLTILVPHVPILQKNGFTWANTVYFICYRSCWLWRIELGMSVQVWMKKRYWAPWNKKSMKLGQFHGTWSHAVFARLEPRIEWGPVNEALPYELIEQLTTSIIVLRILLTLSYYKNQL